MICEFVRASVIPEGQSWFLTEGRKEDLNRR